MSTEDEFKRLCLIAAFTGVIIGLAVLVATGH